MIDQQLSDAVWRTEYLCEKCGRTVPSDSPCPNCFPHEKQKTRLQKREEAWAKITGENPNDRPCLVSVAQRLHEHVCGSGLTLSDAESAAIESFLWLVLRTWQYHPESDYDTAVRELIQAVLAEVNEPRSTSPEKA